MLPLNSPRWSELEAAGGDTLLVPRLIQELKDRPTPGDWGEVWEQVSHQWTGASVGFAAIPHLVHLAIQQGIAATPEFLLGLGRTVDSLAPLGPPPADLAGDYETALRGVSPIVERTVRAPGYPPEDYACVLHAAAALSGRIGLGTQLFFCLCAGGPELDCPVCGAYLSGEFQGTGLVFRSVNNQGRPLSEEAWVRPRPWNPGSIDGDPPEGPFAWLADLCRAARQEEVLRMICLLYGNLVCPLCATEMVVMSEVQRSHSGPGDAPAGDGI